MHPVTNIVILTIIFSLVYFLTVGKFVGKYALWELNRRGITFKKNISCPLYHNRVDIITWRNDEDCIASGIIVHFFLAVLVYFVFFASYS